MTGVAKHTVPKLLKDLGCAAASYHDQHVRNLRVRRVQCDEIWAFVYAKQKNVTLEQMQAGAGDIWTWTAIDADTKLIVSYTLGDRGAGTANVFMQDVASRITNRIQLTTDGHRVYDSSLFLQKHPEQMLLWQIRAAAAISVNDPDAGYESAQRLLAAGAVDSNDPVLQRLLGQLKNNGWLDKQGVESFKRYAWIVGTWSVSWSVGEKPDQHGNGEREVFSKSDSGAIEGFYLSKNGHKNQKPNMRGAILASQVSWTQYFDISDKDPESPGGHSFIVDDAPGRPYYPSGWQAPVSYSLSDDKRTMTMLFPQQSPKRNNKFASQHPVTLVFEKVSDPQ